MTATIPLWNPQLGTREVAEICRVGEMTVRRWVDAGHLCGRRVGVKRVVDYRDLVRFFADNELPDSWLGEFEEQFS